MMNKKNLLTIAILTMTLTIFGQTTTQSVEYKHFIGSDLFLFGNLLEDSPNYYRINYGYRLTPKDVLLLEAITWEYSGPLGRPYDKMGKQYNFPGLVKGYGLGLAYKRFIWKRAYVEIHSTAFRQNYLDDHRKKIQSGFQLFNTLRAGYQINFFKNRLFIEPSVAITYWPINTNLPKSFQVEEDKWPNYFLIEPGFHFGVNF